jgi:hypothetical protein
LVDDAAAMNNRIVRADRSSMIPLNPCETFCVVAAARTEDEKFDQLQNDVLDEGFETAWKRLRSEKVA